MHGRAPRQHKSQDDFEVVSDFGAEPSEAWGFLAYHGDPKKVFLLGHSSGATLVALVGSDDRYLARGNEALGFCVV